MIRSQDPLRSTDRRWIVVLYTGIVASAVVRLTIAVRVPSPYLFADETVGLGLARAIAGFDVEFFGPSGRPLLGVLLSPIAAFTNSPTVLHRSGLLLNAVLLTALAPVLFFTARRFLGYRIPESATVALVGSCGAATFATTSIVRPEALLTFLFTLSVPLLFAVAAKPNWSRVLFIPPVLTIALAAAHPRADATFVALVLAMAIAVARRHLPRSAGILSLGLMVGAYALVRSLSAAINSAVYVNQVGGHDESRILFEPLTEPPYLLRALSGGSWYALIATAGFALIALIGLANSLISSGPTSSLPESYLFLALAGAFALSSLFVSLILVDQVNRTDSFAYGRYIEHTFPAMLLYLPRGWDLIKANTWRKSVLAATGSMIVVLTTVASRQFLPAGYWSGEPLKSNIPAIWFLWGGSRPISPSMVALPLIGVVVLATVVSGWKQRNVVALVLTSGLALSGTWLVFHTEVEYAEYIRGWQPAAQVLDDAEAQNVALPLDSYSTLWAHNLYFWAPNAEFDHFGTLADVPTSAEWLVTGREVTELPSHLHGVLIASFPAQDTYIWKLS